MKNKRKNLIVTLLPIVIIPLIYAAAIVYKKHIIYIPPCPVRMFLGIYCPGCGTTHFLYALLSGDIFSAVRYNAAAAAAVILAILYWLENLLSLFGMNIKIIPRSSIFIYTASGIAAAYFILRNFIPFLAP